MSKTRFHTLDSLRGVAALQVVIAHCLVAVPSLSWLVYRSKVAPAHDLLFYLAYSPLHFLCSATPAVKLFFVLSGFVLSLPYYNNNTSPLYFKFFIKRILRLYVPCLVVILLSLLLRSILYRPHYVNEYGSWVIATWEKEYTFTEIVNLLLLNAKFNNVNLALWTIPPEIKLSLILPLFILFKRRLNVIWSFVFIIFIYVLITFLNKIGLRNIWNDFNIFYYLTFFLIGSLLCKYRSYAIDWINSLSSFAYYMVAGISIYLYTFEYSLWWLPIPNSIFDMLIHFNDYISAFASVILIIIALSNQAQDFFSNSVLLFLGKISFSLYLVHAVLIVSLIYILTGILSPPVVISLAFLLSFPLAVLFYNCIEVPSMKLANSLGSLVGKKKTVLQVI